MTRARRLRAAAERSRFAQKAGTMKGQSALIVCPLLAAAPLACAALFTASPAAAEVEPKMTAPEAPRPDAPEPRPEAPWPLHRAPRPWLYAADPTAPAPLDVVASLGLGYAQVDRGAARPFAADVAHAGAVFNVSGEIGLARFASAYVEGLLAGQGDGTPVAAGAVIGANFFPLAGRIPFDVAISAGYLRELGSDNGIWARVAVAGDIGRVRLSFTALGEHVFAENRDGVDVLLTSGASVAIAPFFRAGAEYVVQDLEGAWDPEEADGGIRHFVGANAILLLARNVQLAAGPALGLSEASPRLLGRLNATYVF
jgi:hypothetical protein